jgi:hypothetical protein
VLLISTEIQLPFVVAGVDTLFQVPAKASEFSN